MGQIELGQPAGSGVGRQTGGIEPGDLAEIQERSNKGIDHVRPPQIQGILWRAAGKAAINLSVKQLWLVTNQGFSVWRVASEPQAFWCARAARRFEPECVRRCPTPC